MGGSSRRQCAKYILRPSPICTEFPPAVTAAAPRIALLTPTYRGDLERFAMLREALEAWGCDWPHYAVVQTEDLPLFRQRLGEARVHWLTTAEVLPPEVEAARRRLSAMPERLRRFRRSLQKRFGWFPDASCDGWHSQQLVKLALPARAEHDAYLVLDSDLVPTAPLRAERYWQNGRAALMAEDNPTFRHWADAAAQVLGLPAETVRGSNFVAHPFVFAPQAVRDLHAHLEARHRKPWWRALLDLKPGDLSEFSIYGAYVRWVAGGAHHYEVAANARTRWVLSAEDSGAVRVAIDGAFNEPDTDFLVLQASRRWPIEPYLPAIRAALQRAVAAG